LVKTKAGTPAASGLSADAQAFNDLCDTVIVVSRGITELFGTLIAEIVAKSIGEVELTTVEVPTGPKLSQFVLPYLFDEDDSLGSVATEPNPAGTP
jgi:hypothetical protein